MSRTSSSRPASPQEIIRVVAEALSARRATARPHPPEDVNREHLRLLNDKLLEKVEELEAAKNDTLAEVNEMALEEQIGRTIAEVVPGLWPRLEPSCRNVLETGEAIVNQDLPGWSRAGSNRTLHWLSSYYPVLLDGEIIAIGIVVVDITERRQAEEFRSVVIDRMAEGLYAMDAERCVTFMNAAASKMLGRRRWTRRGPPSVRRRPRRRAPRA